MSRFKTELCNNLIELGSCKYGDRCHYAHGPTELRQVSKRHPKYRTESCKNFELTGKCPFGPRCSYVHPKPDLDSMIEQLSKYMKHTKAPKPEDSEDDSDDQSLYTTTTTQKSSSSSLECYRPKHFHDQHRLFHNQLARPESSTRCGSVAYFDQENFHQDSMVHSYGHGPSHLKFSNDQENKENLEMIIDANNPKSTSAITRTNFSNKLLPFDKISPNIHNFHAAGLPTQDILNKRSANATFNSNALTNATPKLNAQPISSQALQITTRTPLSSKNGNSSTNSVHDNQSNLHNIYNQQYQHSLINHHHRFNLITSDQITGTSNSYLNSINDAPSTCSNSSLSSIAAAFEQASAFGSDHKSLLTEGTSSSSTTPSTNSLSANLNNQVYSFSTSNPLNEYFNKAHIDGRGLPHKQYYTGF